MASFTLQASPQFPVGTTVSVHPGKAPASGGAPVPALVDDGVVGSDGRVTFTGLTDATSYVAYASVNGQARYMEFTTSVFDKVPYYDGNGVEQRADLSPFGKTLWDDVDAAAARATLGVTAAVDAATDAELETHRADTTDVHGIANTADLMTAAQIAAAYQPLDADLTTYAGKTPPSGAVVGTTDTQTLTNKTLTPEGWTAVTAFSNSWANADPTEALNYKAAYYKSPDGIVRLRGVITSGTNNTTAFTLPAGYRPSKQLRVSTFINTADTGSWPVIIEADGSVKPPMPAVGNNVFLESISFHAG